MQHALHPAPVAPETHPAQRCLALHAWCRLTNPARRFRWTGTKFAWQGSAGRTDCSWLAILSCRVFLFDVRCPCSIFSLSASCSYAT